MYNVKHKVFPQQCGKSIEYCSVLDYIEGDIDGNPDFICISFFDYTGHKTGGISYGI